MVTIARHAPLVMKMKPTLLISAGLLFSSASGWSQPSIASELERGVELLEGGEDLWKAKSHLEMVIHRRKESEKLVAEAYYHLAKCHLALGQRNDARKCVARLREGWPADNVWVVRAGELPLREGIFRATPWKDGELLTYEMEIWHGNDLVGSPRFCSLIMAAEGEDTWTMYGGGSTDVGVFEVAGDDYRITEGRFVTMQAGDQTFDTGEDGELRIRPTGIDKPTVTFPAGGGNDAVYHLSQSMDLLRVLPGEIGKSYTMTFLSPMKEGETIEVKVTATKVGEVEVPAGRFNCVAYEIESGMGPGPQTYWVEKDGRRRVVKIDWGGKMKTSLIASEENWSLEESHLAKANDKVGALQVKVPAGFLAISEPEGQRSLEWMGGETIGLIDTKLRVWSGSVQRFPADDKELAEMRAEGLDLEAVANLVEPMITSLSRVVVNPDEGAVAEEVPGARKLIKVGDDVCAITRLKADRGPLEHERTILITLDRKGIVLCYFDHEEGAGDTALEFLKEIRKSL